MTTLANAPTMPPGMTLAQVPQATISSTNANAQPGRPGKGIVLVYIALALLALIPGAMLKFGMGLGESHAGLLLEDLRLGLMDVRFGFGLRFWLGVSGTTMMGLLLLYPLRKALAKNRLLGSIGRWFHIHHLLGLAAPVLILYHSNFGLGDTNSNVALWAMLCVVISGVVGHFVYGGVSAQYYAGKQEAQEPRDAIVATLAGLDAMHGAQQHFIDELKLLEADLLTPRRGVIASIVARLKVEQRHRHLARSANWLITGAAHELRMSAAQCDQLQNDVGGHLIAFLRIARAAASGSIREQLWARWRLFHLPAFLIMSIAMTLHIVAVWDIDVWGVRANLPVIEATAPSGEGSQGGVAAPRTEHNVARASPARENRSVATIEQPVQRPAAPLAAAGIKTIGDLVAALPAGTTPTTTASKFKRVAIVRPIKRMALAPAALAEPNALPATTTRIQHVLVVKPRPAAQPRAKPVTSPANKSASVSLLVPKPVRARRRIAKRRSSPVSEFSRTIAKAQPRTARPPVLLASARPGSFIKKLSGLWVEGPGFDVTYGGNYNGCAKRCLGNRKCVMLEYYRPERKCNLYDRMRPRKSGGSSNVGIRHLRLSGITTKFQN